MPEWKPLAADDIPTAEQRTKEQVYLRPDQPSAGRWHILADGRVLHETLDGNWQVALHDHEALSDPARFTLVNAQD